ncbi:superoxide dismutase family protein [Arvimicrobium flavum]|uniref:superoxide dismutase family protein n=1 Tax=Arvimicrobium flavum TaxID=3393320 RepID=UPI00237B7A1B|nr:superoxide dismutase family protein [Mesorhizobium shangrilense]
MRRFLAAACLVTLFPLSAVAQEASAKMVGPDGKELGAVAITQTKSGMLSISVDMNGLPPGVHGFHIHTTGKCEGPTFESAGGHLAGGKAHGVNAENGPHPGDFPNVNVAPDGTLKVEFFTDRLSLGEGENALLDADGASVMLHEGPDDYATDPSGHSGGRIACGVIAQAT